MNSELINAVFLMLYGFWDCQPFPSFQNTAWIDFKCVPKWFFCHACIKQRSYEMLKIDVKLFIFAYFYYCLRFTAQFNSPIIFCPTTLNTLLQCKTLLPSIKIYYFVFKHVICKPFFSIFNCKMLSDVKTVIFHFYRLKLYGSSPWFVILRKKK